MTSLKAAANLSFIAAAALLLGGILFLSGLGVERQYVDGEASINLNNYTQLKTLWMARREARGSFLGADAFEVIGWLCVIPPVQAAATIMGGGQKSATAMFTATFITLAIVNIVDFTFQAGSTSVADAFSFYFEKRGSGVPPGYDQDDLLAVPWPNSLQLLELNYRMARSRALWISALDNILLMIGFGVGAFLACDSRQEALSKNWARFCVVCALFSFAGAMAGIARAAEFGDTRFGILRPINGIYFLSVISVLLPIWLVWLGVQLQGNHGKEFHEFPREFHTPRNVHVEMPSANVGQASPTGPGLA